MNKFWKSICLLFLAAYLSGCAASFIIEGDENSVTIARNQLSEMWHLERKADAHCQKHFKGGENQTVTATLTSCSSPYSLGNSCTFVCRTSTVKRPSSTFENAPEILRIDNVPMYGLPNVERPKAHQEADQRFIESAMETMRKHTKKTTRREASEEWYAVGVNFMRQGNFDYAMRRFNQAWLLDPENFQPYWGFATITITRRKQFSGVKHWEKIEEAIGFLQRALSLVDDDKQKVALLGDIATAHSLAAVYYQDRKETQAAANMFREANAYFVKAQNLEPTYGNIFRYWAMSLIRENQFVEACAKVKRARQLNARPIKPSLLSSLYKNYPECKNLL